MRHSRSKKIAVLFVGVLFVLALVLVLLTWRQVRQERISRELIAAILRNDSSAAIPLLQQGADANARDEAPHSLSSWSRLMLIFHLKPMPVSTAPTALLLALEGPEKTGDDWEVNPELVQALLDHGAQVNVT